MGAGNNGGVDQDRGWSTGQTGSSFYAAGCKSDPDAVVGRAVSVWEWFDKHTVDGNAHGVTFSIVDRLVGVTGFGEAMPFAGWLEQRDMVLHAQVRQAHIKSAKKRALGSGQTAEIP